jgi:His-Xaa-Ser system radical SAM maturase HxsC
MGKVTRSPIAEIAARRDHIVDARMANLFSGDWDGYAGAIRVSGDEGEIPLPTISRLANLEYLSDGDVVLMLPNGRVNVLYRRASPHNTILTTERCNSLCLMCSQPPKDVDDSHRVGEILRLVELVDPACHELGISGGEPALLGQDLLRIIAKCEERLPETSLHLLTNGRLFNDRAFAHRLGAIRHHDLMLGIPLYADVAQVHDFVVQAAGAFDETLDGLYNLAEAGVPIEIRVVLHRQTYERLPQLAEFIYRNLPFVCQVALMGMEMFGLVHYNIETLWIDPMDYQEQLEAATMALSLRGMRVLLYNHQLCVLRSRLWPFAVRSISDWKNAYLSECERCSVREQCGGLFWSGLKRHSEFIRAFEDKRIDA